MHSAGLADELLRRLHSAPALRIVVERVQGSGPREAGAWMAVFGDAAGGSIGTIGGGRLEFDAVADARALLRGQPLPRPLTWDDRLSILTALWDLNDLEAAEGKLTALSARARRMLARLSQGLPTN